MENFKIKKKSLIIFCIISLITVLFQIVMSNQVQKIIDLVEKIDEGSLLTPFIVAILSIIFYQVFTVIKSKYTSRVIKECIINIKQELFSSFFYSNPGKKSKYVSLFCNDLNIVEEKYYGAILKIVESASVLVMIFGVLIYINIYIFIGILVILIVNFLISILSQKSISLQVEELTKSYEKEMEILDNYFEGYITIKSLRMEKVTVEKYNERCKELESKKYNYSCKISTITSVLEGFSFLNIIIITFISSFFIKNGDITLGTLISITIFSNILFLDFPALLMSILEVKSSGMIMGKVKKLSFREGRKVDMQTQPFENLYIEDLKVKFDNRNIIDDFNYQISKGEKICIIGDNGTGKSTFVNCLFSLVPYEGKIFYNGRSIKDIDAFKAIKYIPQKPFVFSDTVEFNILLGNEIADREYFNMVIGEMGLLQIYTERKKEIIGENDMNISGGEKQRMAIARMLLQKPEVLIMDESLSMIDEKSRKDIIEFILKLKITLIHITHNTELNNLYDKVINFNFV